MRRLKLEGYKSFRNEDISFGDVTVLLGANGAGKSNLRAKIEFVRSNQNWREKDRSDYLFGPHQLSDGTLRFMALATLLLQPPEQLPNVIILDEPELGLHPFAISVLAGMVRSVATRVQVVLATQSTRLVDEFDPRHIVIIEAEGDAGTKCHRPNPADLAEWLQDYSLGELWEKNHFGGRP